jgi:hypothetical protein
MEEVKDNAAVIEPPDTNYFDFTEPDCLYDSAPVGGAVADAKKTAELAREIAWRLETAAQLLREARGFRVAFPPSFDKTLEGYERHLSNRAAHFAKLSRGPGDCVLCSAGDIHDAGGCFWTDDRWICASCWGQVADHFKSAGPLF